MDFNILRSTMFSVTSQYALRALAQMARNGNQQAMLGKDLAIKAEIPPNYLAKILLSLKNERDQCSDENPCLAHERWRKIRNDYMEFLEDTTIADLASNVTLATAALAEPEPNA